MTDTISDWEINSGNDEKISYVRLGWLGQDGQIRLVRLGQVRLVRLGQVRLIRLGWLCQVGQVTLGWLYYVRLGYHEIC